MQNKEKGISEFDRRHNRQNTHDLKWRREGVESYLSQPIREDMIPMWIADTDFGCMKEIVDAVKKRAEHEIYGYCAPGKDFYSGIIFWEKARFQWDILPQWITALPSVVSGINIAIRAFTEEGDGVIIQTPVYDPFITIVKRTGRTPVYNCLKETNGHYEMDFETLEKQVQNEKNKMLILCSPHNPVGRVWTREELIRLAELCLENHVMIVTDEIHSDIVYGDNQHTPLLSLDRRYAEHFIHLSAPGKTFNVPGLKMSFSLIPNPEIKKAFEQMQLAMSLDIRNTFGVECIRACYTQEGIQWLSGLLSYLEANAELVSDFIASEMPKVKMRKPEGTFLCWLDFTDYGMSDEELLKRVNLDAGVICVPGAWFGEGGEHHLRLNIGCQRETLEQALGRIRKALES
ncbi:MAG: MalY/PatB family protein [Eubacteriales bacterium]|nr:MalY/PatB family protein [Eubacteriales bacterium]